MSSDPVHRRDRRPAGSRGPAALDLETLPRDVRAAVEAALDGHEVTVRCDGRDLGVLAFRPAVLQGTVVSGPRVDPAATAAPDAVRDGVTVVATATKLSDAARRRLSDELGPDYIVLDLLKAPPTADVLLTHPVSPQLLGSLRAGFPNARIIVTEIDDEELGVSQLGPVSRLLDAGASAYLPPRPLREVASNVHAYLTGSGAAQISSADADAERPGMLRLPPSRPAE